MNCKDDVKTIDINTVPWEERKLHVPHLRVVARGKFNLQVLHGKSTRKNHFLIFKVKSIFGST